MVSRCSWFGFEELSEVWITLFDLSHAPLILSILLDFGLAVALVNESTLAALSLLDVSKVAVAIESKDTQEQHEVAVSIVVEHVWLVPVWELAHILMGEWGLIAWLEVT